MKFLKYLISLACLTAGAVSAQNMYLVRDVDTIADLVTVPPVRTMGMVAVFDPLRGGMFLATNTVTGTNSGTRIASSTSGWSWQRQFSGPVDVRWFGAVPDGGITDCEPAIQEAVDWASTNGCAVYIPGASNYYFVNEVVSLPSYTVLYGDGMGKTWLRNTNTVLTDPVGWNGAGTFSFNVLNAGNYGGWSDTAPFYINPITNLTYYGLIQSTNAALQVQLDTASETNNFADGDIVFIKSLEVHPETVYMPYYCQVNKIENVSSNGIIRLVHPLNWAFDGNASMAASSPFATGEDGRPTYMAEDVVIRDMTLQTDKETNWSTVYLSAYNLLMENVELIANRRGLGSNPLAYSVLRNIRFQGLDEVLYPNPSDNPALEFTYYNNNNLITDFHISHGILNLVESGSHIVVRNGFIGNGGFGTQMKHKVTFDNIYVQTARGTKSGDSAISIGTYSEDISVINCTLADAAEHYGVILANQCSGTRIIGCNINGGDTAGKNAIHIASTAHDYVITGNVLGEPGGTRNAQDIIYNYGTTNLGTISGNYGFLTLPKFVDLEYETSTNTTETLWKSYTVPGQRFQANQGIRIEAYGTSTGTASNKIVRLRVGAMYANDPATTITFTPTQNGAWQLNTRIQSRVYESGGTNSQIRVISDYVKEGINLQIPKNEIWTSADLRTDWAVTLTGEVADTNDAVIVHGFTVEPYPDIGQ